MRLTLRTLLAYLDDVLEPSDAEKLGTKIQESEFASSLIHRIRSTMRKLRLGAPKLEGRGTQLDANTVAEYLDSTLTSDRVPDFEKACLESDVHLAEVASCHQILTLVLGEPADVETSVRQRIYQLATLPGEGNVSGADAQDPSQGTAVETQAAPPGTESGATEQNATDRNPQSAEAVAEDAPAAHQRVSPSKPEIPDYLKASKRRRVLPYLATALLVFLIVSVALLAIGPQKLVALFRGGDQIAQADPAVDEPDEDDVTDEASVEDQSDEQTGARTSPPAGEAGNESAAESSVDSTASDVAELDTVSDFSDAGSGDAGSAPTATTGDSGNSASGPANSSPSESDTTEPAEPASSTAELNGSDTITAQPGPIPTEPFADPAEATSDVGVYSSEKQILSRFRSETDQWYRLPPNTPLSPGDRILVVPNYRPQISLATGIQLTFAGPSLIELGPLDSRGFQPLRIGYGQIVMLNIGGGGTQVHLDLGGRSVNVTFEGAASRLAIHVQRYLPPGTDPIEGVAHEIAQLITTNGSVQVQEGEKTVSVEAGSVHVMVDDRPGWTVAVPAPPPWVDASRTSDIEQIAAQGLEKLVDTERPLVVSLEERVADDLVEVRSLASRCLSFLDRHESFVNMLMNPNDKSFWDESFDTAQQAIARSPESANLVLSAFQKLRGVDAEPLFRMLWGYNQQQLVNDGEDEILVEYLNHESLDYRVLAFMNLERITGKTHLYRPEAVARRRQNSFRQWQDRAARGEIKFAFPLTLPVPPPPTDAVAPAGATRGATSETPFPPAAGTGPRIGNPSEADLPTGLPAEPAGQPF